MFEKYKKIKYPDFQAMTLPLRYDDAPPDEYEYSQSPTSTDGAGPSAPQFPEHLHSLLTHS